MESALVEQLDLDLFTGFAVKIEIFEGPVDLLVYLVRREELDISEIALAQITGPYLAYLETMEAINIEVAGEFVVTAATLLQIKSRRLLPATAVEDLEEEEDELELVSQMQQHAAQYRAYREAAEALAESRQLRRQVYVRALEGSGAMASGFVRLEDISIFDLVGAVRELLEHAEEETAHTVQRPAVTLAERIEDILFQLRAAGDQPLSFVELVGTPVTRQFIVMSFLALLELMRRRRVQVRQDKPRADIVIQLVSESALATEAAAQQS